MEKCLKNNFDQPTDCGAPISWSKYTTYQQNLVGIVQISKGCGKNLKNVGQKKVFISKTNPLFILVPHNILPIPKSKNTKNIKSKEHSKLFQNFKTVFINPVEVKFVSVASEYWRDKDCFVRKGLKSPIFAIRHFSHP